MVIAVGILGLILGSFLNVVIYRFPRGLSVVYPGSHCPSCRKPIRFYDNVPLISYLLLKGHCRQCGSPIPWRYPFVEGLTALCLVALFLRYGYSENFIVFGVLMLFLIPITVIDVQTGLILNKLTIPGFILGVLLILGLQIETWKEALFGVLAGGGIMGLIACAGKILFRKESLGMGDVKLLVMLGVYVGFPAVGICLFFGILAAGIFVFVGLVFKKLRFGNIIPFGPFIAIGTIVYLMWGEPIVNWYVGRF